MDDITAAETVFLLEQHFDDVLIGYPVMEVAPVLHLLKFMKEGRIVTFMVDKLEHVAPLAKLGAEINIKLPVCIDVNTSTDFKVLYFGTKRSSLHSLAQLTLFLEYVKKSRMSRL